MDSDQIEKKGPHAYPFRMIDRIVEIKPGKKAVAIKNVSIDEFWFAASPETPVLPWVLILEALAQTAGLACAVSERACGRSRSVPVLAAVDRFRISGKAGPGDQILLEAETEYTFSCLSKVSAVATVNGERLAEARLTLAEVSMEMNEV